MQRHGRFGSRRLAVGACAAIALVGAVVGVAAARVIPVGHGAGTRTSRAAASRHGAAARTARIAGAGAQSGVTNPHGLAVAGRAAGPRAGLGAPRTSCQSVAHVGDSTSVDLISPAFVPNPAERIAARYAQVGVKHLSIDASGGRSIVEELPGQRNGYQVASAWRARGRWPSTRTCGYSTGLASRGRPGSNPTGSTTTRSAALSGRRRSPTRWP